ncbi:putative cytosolic protein [Smithella sp. ME-1]|uniref:Uncharacterized protein n=1 Tax=hydrocarbon metagenome TaxID=938273 RepID=A0A0W8FPX9_9ZZZZ|nr:putative cytosolic protein [Smithella sp. ME-1]
MVINKDLDYVFNVLTQHELGKKYSTPVLAYVSLFAVTPFHLKSSKFRRILEDVVKLFDSQAFGFQKKIFRISHAGIIEALDICIKKNFTEVLENHNYLKKVMISISEREGKSASIQAEKKHRQREDNALSGNGRPEEEDFSNITHEKRQANLQRVGEIIKSIGG